MTIRSTRSRAEVLLRSLEHGFGELVVDLSSLGVWASCIDTHTYDDHRAIAAPTYSIRGKSLGYSWAIATLRACPNVRTVDVYLGSAKPSHARLAATLRGLSCLQTIALSPRGSSPVEPSYLLPFFELITLSSATNVRITDIRWVGALLHEPPRRISSADRVQHIRSLHLSAAQYSTGWGKLIAFVPSTELLPSLRELVLEAHWLGAAKITHVLTISLERLAPQLESLTIIDSAFRHDSICSADAYGHDHRGAGLPVHFFERLPSIQMLTAKNFNGVSVAILEALAAHSPRLRSIDFRGSVWVEDDRDETSRLSVPLSGEFPEHMIDDALSRMHELEYVHLGKVKLRPGEQLAVLPKTTRNRGVELQYDTCDDVPRCLYCGGFHRLI